MCPIDPVEGPQLGPSSGGEVASREPATTGDRASIAGSPRCAVAVPYITAAAIAGASLHLAAPREAAARGCGPPESTDAADPSGSGLDTLRRLVDRTTFGFSWGELEYAYTHGYDGFLDNQLAYEQLDDGLLDARLRQFPTLFESAREHFLRGLAGDYLMAEELTNASILRAATSRRQLFERVVEFWSDHFNVFMFKGRCKIFKAAEDRDVVRRHAMGSFPALLRATARSPAMLAFLDNVYSTSEAPNQNFARELMELHTIGPDAFRQGDVEEVARCFTGWSVDVDPGSDTAAQFVFRPEWHDDSPKRVLGYDIPSGGGVGDGEAVLSILCFSPDIAPCTGRLVGRKLAERFWGANPPNRLIEELANTFVATGGDIRSMLRVTLAERWLAHAPAKLKRPLHLALSTLRTIPSLINGFVSLRSVLHIMGHTPFSWVAPDGYPDDFDYWAGGILPRWRIGFRLVQEQDDIPLDCSIFLRDSPEQVADAIDLYLFAGKLPGRERQRLIEYLTAGPFNDYRVLDAVGLAVACPAFQLY